MTLKQRIDAFAQVGHFIQRHYHGTRIESERPLHEGLDKVIEIAETYNNWFIPKFVNDAIQGIGLWLNTAELSAFTKNLREIQPRMVALVCAGNLPLVCFHDLLCILISGHKVLIKLSGDDKVLPPFFLKLLCHFEPAFEQQIFFADGKLGSFDAVIATGSNNTAGHLRHYFGKYPHIIRQSRGSLAILDGSESDEELRLLGRDIFQYFGLGCRNVSKLMVPKNYSFNRFFESIVDYGFVVNNKKYGNNYDYHRAIYLLESIPFLDNNFLMIREQTALLSPVAVLHYQFYDSPAEIEQYLREQSENIQCVVGKGHVPYGYSQSPVISDFADKVDTLDFLVNL